MADPVEMSRTFRLKRASDYGLRQVLVTVLADLMRLYVVEPTKAGRLATIAFDSFSIGVNVRGEYVASFEMTGPQDFIDEVTHVVADYQ